MAHHAALSPALAVITACVLAAHGADAMPGFALSGTIGNHMVLQRGAPTTSVWGFAPAGSVVNVELSGVARVNATAGADGIWRAALPALPASEVRNPLNLTFTDAAVPGAPPLAVLSDVLVGDLLLCSGQSNMEFSIGMSLNATAEVAAIDAFGPAIRVATVRGHVQATPMVDFSLPWSRASSSMGGSGWHGFSGTCWFTGRDLFLALGGTVPVGLVESCVGGTSIRSWTPTAGLAACPQPYIAPARHAPVAPGSILWNGMIAPLTTGPTRFKAVIWDQAEADSFPAAPVGFYACATVAQIFSWRTAWGAPTMLWVFVHLQPYTLAPPGAFLEDLRSEQLAAAFLPAVAVASAIDLGDPTSPYVDIHFRAKQVISARAVIAALAVGYAGEAPAGAAAYPPPAFLQQTAYYANTTGEATIEVTFSPGASGGNVTLAPAPPCPTNITAANCSSFMILGSDGGAYETANATLTAPAPGTGGAPTLLLSVLLPHGVYGVGSSYAWAMWPLARLFTTAGLPILPWRQGLGLDGPPGPPPSAQGAQ